MPRFKSDSAVIHVYLNSSKEASVMESHFSIGTLLTFHADRLQYMSADALLDLLEGYADMMLELKTGVKQANIIIDMVGRLRSTKDKVMERYSWLHDLPDFRLKILDLICEYILRDSQCGRLHGFTFVKCEAGESGGMIATSESICDPEKEFVEQHYAGYHEARQRDAEKAKR